MRAGVEQHFRCISALRMEYTAIIRFVTGKIELNGFVFKTRIRGGLIFSLRYRTLTQFSGIQNLPRFRDCTGLFQVTSNIRLDSDKLQLSPGLALELHEKGKLRNCSSSLRTGPQLLSYASS